MRFSRKSPAKELVTCTACGHEQRDYPNANVTYCQKCGHRIVLQTKTKTRTKKKAPVEQRQVRCLQCHHELLIHAEAMTWQCNACSAFIDLRNHEIDREFNTAILTYGDIAIGPKGVFAGGKAEAENIRIAGRSTSRLVSRNILVVQGHAKLGAGAAGGHLLVPASASLYSEGLLAFRSAEIRGHVQAWQVRVTEQLAIYPGGHLTANLLEVNGLVVEPGGKLLTRCLTLQSETAITDPLAGPAADEPEI
ncbi:MAG: hypothetical protein PHD76_03425 [Methylacidiphilales bacterium]|nr:hypothetical protein [Candidatus Methylacidiphilales bacterium]